MIELIKLFSLLAVLIILIRLKVHLALALVIDTIVMILIYGIPLQEILKSFVFLVNQPDNWTLLGAVIFITYLGTLLSDQGNFKRVFASLSLVIKDLRYVIALIPAIIGLIPMPGGALFSAPMVDEGGNILNLKSGEKHHVNFIFRHMWEFFWPIYPAILLIGNFFHIQMGTIIAKQSLYSLIYFITGILFFIIPLKTIRKNPPAGEKNAAPSKNKLIWQFIVDFWPVILLILTLLIFKISIVFIVPPIIILFIISKKLTFKQSIQLFKKSFSFSIIAIIFAILIFKSLIQSSGILDTLPGALTELGIHPLIVISFTPFILGFLTGITVGSVGVAFPVLQAFYIAQGQVNYSFVVLSLVAGFWGVMVSPMHLCLSLTKEYYKANYKEIYPKLIPYFILNIGLAILLTILNYPGFLPIKG